MHSKYSIPPWKASPFIRLVLPLFAGVLLQWYFKPDLLNILSLFCTTVAVFFLSSSFTLARRYKLRWLQGLLIQTLILLAGSLLTWNNDIRNNKRWFAHTYADSDCLIVDIAEPLIKKQKTYKADGAVVSVIHLETVSHVTGRLIMYFLDTPALNYGDRILIRKNLQPIKNTGNPAAFDYARYASFQQQFHTVFLGKGDYSILTRSDGNAFDAFVFESRTYILSTLKKYVGKDQRITGIAEALLIGYKHDLDKDLMQAYSNTGVVHIIAISGLHLGLIYVMLNWIMNVLPWIKRQSTIRVLFVLSCLWLFSILTGSSASVLRSALMFTCILIGKTYFTQSSVYNAIAASAFILVCYDPYFLWDVGFQLSYLAVLGIVWLQKPILHIIYVKNSWLNKIWNMVAVTLAAQLAAFPLCIYYFHQFPNLFLITNILAVPLSTLILFAEIGLMCISWADVVASHAGKFISMMIELMNTIIIYFDKIPGSVTTDIYATSLTTWFLYAIVFFTCAWLIYRKTILLKCLLLSISIFAGLHLLADLKHAKQNKVIVYNVSKFQAIDFISGTSFFFVGDSVVRRPGFLQNFHVRPARILLQARREVDPLTLYDPITSAVSFKGKRIFIVERSVAYDTIVQKVHIDLLVISRNPRLKIADLLTALKPSIIVFDASNSLWKIEEWKKECSALLLRFHSVPEQGAFVSDLNQL